MNPLQEPAAREPEPPTGRPQFVVNVLWSWLGVAVNLFVGLVLSRYIIRTLGEERYGIWALVFAMLEYLWFFDLGFNTAVTNFSARFAARDEPARINEVVNTALAYFSGVAVVLMIVTVAISRSVERLFPRLSPAYRDEFSTLVLVTGLSWSFFVLLHIFTSCLDGFQRFDLTTRAWVITLLVRSGGAVVVLALGYGLVEMGIAAAVGQALGYVLNFASFRRVFPALRFSGSFVRASMFREMVRYGVPSFAANASNLLLNQSTPVLLGRFRSLAEVGFFTLPMRLLQYAVDAVSRVGLITRSNTAERDATGRKASVLQLGIYSNRYCFLLFAPLALFLLIYGKELIYIWITPAYAEASAPLLPVLVPAIALVMAGQFNSSAILFGLGAHQRYAWGLMLEATASVAAMVFIIPRHGVVGAAWVASGLMLAVRGVYTPWLVCRSLETSVTRYLGAIYVRPLLVAAPVFGAGLLLKREWIRGNSWGELIVAAAVMGGAYLVAAWRVSVEREHKDLLRTWIQAKS